MSRGSTFTLYRVYDGFKVPEDVVRGAIASAIARERRGLWSVKERSDEELELGLPLVLSAYSRSVDEPWEAEPKPQSVDEYRHRHFASTFLRKEGLWCDRLLEWTFCSWFDALVNEWNLNYYGPTSDTIVSREDASEILAAAEYLLSGRWESRELVLNNRYVNVLAKGNSSSEYWKYVKRAENEKKARVHTFEDAGCKVTIELPELSKRDEEDEWDCSEDNEQSERDLRRLCTALRAYLESGDYPWEKETRLMLVYEACG